MKKRNLTPALVVASLLLVALFLPAPASAGHDYGSSGLSIRGVFVLPPLFPFAFVAPPPVVGIADSWRGHDHHDDRDGGGHRPGHRHWGRRGYDHHDRGRDFDREGHGWRR